VRISERVSQLFVVTKVSPQYPDEARKKHIEGSVVMQPEISAEGAVEALKVISGDPLLATAATKAVKQWKYKPYLLNGEPIAVETQVTVNFALSAE
jgi:protein TonB